MTRDAVVSDLPELCVETPVARAGRRPSNHPGRCATEQPNNIRNTSFYLTNQAAPDGTGMRGATAQEMTGSCRIIVLRVSC